MREGARSSGLQIDCDGGTESQRFEKAIFRQGFWWCHVRTCGLPMTSQPGYEGSVNRVTTQCRGCDVRYVHLSVEDQEHRLDRHSRHGRVRGNARVVNVDCEVLDHMNLMTHLVADLKSLDAELMKSASVSRPASQVPLMPRSRRGVGKNTVPKSFFAS